MKSRKFTNYAFEESGEILGLLALRERPDPGLLCVEIVSIETRTDQRGKQRRHDRIAGCLLGFAARVSIKRGYDGYLMLDSKTATASIYEKTYGFIKIGNVNPLIPRMISIPANSQKLIHEYLQE
jgi:hypothetical protein